MKQQQTYVFKHSNSMVGDIFVLSDELTETKTEYVLSGGISMRINENCIDIDLHIKNAVFPKAHYTLQTVEPDGLFLCALLKHATMDNIDLRDVILDLEKVNLDALKQHADIITSAKMIIPDELDKIKEFVDENNTKYAQMKRLVTKLDESMILVTRLARFYLQNSSKGELKIKEIYNNQQYIDQYRGKFLHVHYQTMPDLYFFIPNNGHNPICIKEHEIEECDERTPSAFWGKDMNAEVNVISLEQLKEARPKMAAIIEALKSADNG